jgi:hypothetical protein
LYSILCFYFFVWILESLRQGLHVVASWDYHRGAKIRGSVRGNPGRFTEPRFFHELPVLMGAYPGATPSAVVPCMNWCSLVTVCESGFVLCTFFCRNLSPCLESPKPPSPCSSPLSLVCRPLSHASLFLLVPLHSCYPSTTLSHDSGGLLTAAMHPSTTLLALPFP